MPGTPTIDIALVTNGVLPEMPDDVIQQMENLGFVYAGPSPHCMNKYHDQWFQKLEPFENGDRVIVTQVVHILSVQEASSTLQDFIDFREYVSQNKEAFEKYKNYKLATSQETYINYKKNKSEVVNQIKNEVKIWKQ